MSEYRPYINAATFTYPLDHASKSQYAYEPDSNGFDYLHIDELVSANSQITAVGSSVVKFYLGMVFSQPFEVCRFLTQVGDWRLNTNPLASASRIEEASGESVTLNTTTSEAGEEEDIDYFVDVSVSRSQEPKVEKSSALQIYNPADDPDASSIDMSNGPFILPTASALLKKEKINGLWRAMNASCLRKAATGVVGAWMTSFLASVCGVPDPQFVDLLHTLYPMRVAAVSIAGCAVTAYLMAPLSIIRARLIATSINNPDKPRSLRWSLRDLVQRGKFFAPLSAALPSMLNAVIKNAIMMLCPVLCFKYAEIDAFNTPQLFHFAQLCAEIVFLIFKLPLDTLASRAELHADKENQIPRENAVIKLYPYKGLFSNLWDVCSGKQPLASLYRGWRSELVGVIGEWGYEALDDKSRDQERF